MTDTILDFRFLRKPRRLARLAAAGCSSRVYRPRTYTRGPKGRGMTKQWYCPTCNRVHATGFQQAAPHRVTWQQMAVDGLKDAAEVILGVAVFLGLFIGIPFLLWLVAS